MGSLLDGALDTVGEAVGMVVLLFVLLFTGPAAAALLSTLTPAAAVTMTFVLSAGAPSTTAAALAESTTAESPEMISPFRIRLLDFGTGSLCPLSGDLMKDGALFVDVGEEALLLLMAIGASASRRRSAAVGRCILFSTVHVIEETMELVIDAVCVCELVGPILVIDSPLVAINEWFVGRRQQESVR